MPVPDLSRTSVFLDFDGTMSVADTCVHLLERFAGPEWKAIDAQYLAGEIGSRVGLSREWALLPHEQELLRSVAGEVGLDPDIEVLVDALLAHGAEVTVLSDGYGFYLEDQIGYLRARGIRVVSSIVDWEHGTLEFPNGDSDCACAECGTCKIAPVQFASARGRTTVLVGDGTSDRRAAAVADVVFAKDGLARWCLDSEVRFHPFERLADVHRSLVRAAIRR